MATVGVVLCSVSSFAKHVQACVRNGKQSTFSNQAQPEAHAMHAVQAAVEHLLMVVPVQTMCGSGFCY